MIDRTARIPNLTKAVASPLILLIRAYQQLVAPFLVRSCRFYPSCSTYAIEALNRQGIFKGVWLSMIRILKCHPFHPGGYDPVK